MPFLHWDQVKLWEKRDKIIRDPSLPPPLPILHDPVESRDARLLKASLRDARLLKAYLRDDHPLHIRRTLYQYYYNAVPNKVEMDERQVVIRYSTDNRLKPKVITMVDQLWLWVLNGVGDKPGTVVSCFPHAKQTDPYGSDGLKDLLDHIHDNLSKASSSVETAYDLAELIATTCSELYLDPGSTLGFENDQATLQFFDLYEAELSKRVSTYIYTYLSALQAPSVCIYLPRKRSKRKPNCLTLS